MIFIIDNDRCYSDRCLYFIEADPKVTLPLLEAMERGWPRTCHGCGRKRAEVTSVRCSKPMSGARLHEYRENPYLVGYAETIAWRDLGTPQDPRTMSLATWLSFVVDQIHDEVADLAAAREFVRLGREANPDLWWEKFDFTDAK